MHLDAKDRKILFELDYGARTPLSEIGKRLRLPKQLVSYRIGSLMGKGVIKGFVAVINLSKLGYSIYRVYLRFQNVSPGDEDAIFSKLAAFPNIAWLASTSGRWDAEAHFVARNNQHFGRLLWGFKKQIGSHVKDYAVSPGIGVFHFKRKYLAEGGDEEEVEYGFESKTEEIDEMDFKILKSLSADAAAPLTKIGAAVGMNYLSVKKRMQNLEKRGVITSYRTWIDCGKLGRKHYKALISLSGMDGKLEKSLVSFCNSENSVIYLVACTGNWDLEIEAEAKDENDFYALLLRFRNHFKGLVKDYEILSVRKEHRLDYLPFEKYADLQL